MQEVECLDAIYREMGLPMETADAPDVALTELLLLLSAWVAKNKALRTKNKALIVTS